MNILTERLFLLLVMLIAIAISAGFIKSEFEGFVKDTTKSVRIENVRL